MAVRGLLAELRGHDLGAPYESVPYFWSDQYGIRLQVAGLPGTGVPRVAAGDWDGERLVAVEEAAGVAVAAVGWNAPKEFARARRAISQARLTRVGHVPGRTR